MLLRTASTLLAARTMSTAPGLALRYHQHGNPQNALKLEEYALEAKKGEVVVEFLAAPVNPADLNMVQGVYGLQPELPAIGGNEGVARVVDGGASELKPGDWVIPAAPGLGTWRTHGAFSRDQLVQVDNTLPVEAAATLAVNPSTALRLLEDFGEGLQPGDWIIQNAANSMVGQCVAQLAKAKGIHSINVVRERGEQAHGYLVERMKKHGADMVVTDAFVRTPAFKKILSEMPKPKLALNATGGQMATEIARTLEPGSTMVTYGGMARKPVQMPTSLFIFNDLTLKGFWLSRWVDQNPLQARLDMYKKLTQLIQDKKLAVWFETWKLSEHQDALSRALKERRDRKVIFTLSE